MPSNKKTISKDEVRKRRRANVRSRVGGTTWSALNKRKRDPEEEFDQVDEEYDDSVTPEQLREVRLIDNDTWYPIYTDVPHSYQADLTFHRVRTKDMLQGVFCCININTRVGFAQPMQYRLKRRGTERNWNDRRNENAAQYKDMKTVLRNFVKTLLYFNHINRHIRVLYTDEGKEFDNRLFSEFCEDPMAFIKNNVGDFNFF